MERGGRIRTSGDEPTKTSPPTKSSLNQGSGKSHLICGLHYKAAGRDVERTERGGAVWKQGRERGKTRAPARFAPQGILGRICAGRAYRKKKG